MPDHSNLFDKLFLSTIYNVFWLPYVILTISLIANAFIWVNLDKHRTAHLSELINLHLNSEIELIENGSRSRILALQRIVDRWTIRGGTPKEEFLMDAKNYYHDDHC